MNSHRATQSEHLDDPDFDPQLAARSYQLMTRVNRLFGGTRIVRRWISEQIRAAATETPKSPRPPLRILDIGAGTCDIPIAVSRRLRAQAIETEWTCLEPSPIARRMATRNIVRNSAEGHISLLSDDAFQHQPAEPYDLALGSMFFHHLDDDGIVRLVAQLRTCVRRNLLINDLLRSRCHYLAAKIITRPLPPEIRHDALLSIRRSFRLGDLTRLLSPLSLEVHEYRAWLFRLGAIVRFDKGRAQ